MTAQNPVDKSPCFRILLAEDTPSNQVRVRQALESEGYAVDIAENGRDAVTLSQERHYDLILMDIQMPVMDGLEATTKIRSVETAGRVPIIAFSALPPGQYREQCRGAGMDDYIHKPFDEKSLSRAINRWLDRRPVILIVDDLDESRRLIEDHLSKMKCYRTASAANGIQAIKAVKNQRIALILMDMEMPLMDGYTASRTIRTLGLSPEIPIIAMTAHEGEEEIKKCMKAGCNGYIHKPVRRSSLITAISDHLKHLEKEVLSNCRQESVRVNPDIRELIPGYLDNRRRDAAVITGLLAEGDIEEVRRLGHSMAGSGGGYGFQKISSLGKAIEKASLAGDLKGIERANSRLTEYLQNVNIIFNQEE
jgi:CheY-like chemotaxis protein